MLHLRWSRLFVSPFVFSMLPLVACTTRSEDETERFVVEDIEEAAQAVGDMMASADESAGANDGSFAMRFRRMQHKFDTPLDRVMDFLIPSAHAEACTTLDTFGTCTNGSLQRTFQGCTIGNVTLNGGVTLTWVPGNNCRLDVDGDEVTRVSNFTISGRRGGTLTVGGGGQEIRRSGTDTYAYHVTGLTRVLRGPAGSTIAEVSSRTTTDLGITGSSRNTRVMNGGRLQLTHVTKDYVVALTPNNLTWTGSCTCATSGTLTGTVTRDDQKDITITVTACGELSVNVEGIITPVTLDRCNVL